MTKLKPYTKYKDSSIEWLGEIPEGWNVRKLKYLLVKNEGGIWGDFSKAGFVVLRSTEITVDGNWRIDNPPKISVNKRGAKNKRLRTNDLLVTKSSGSKEHIGKTAFVDKKIASLKPVFSNFMQRLRVKEQRLFARLLYYLLNSRIARNQYIIQQNSTSGLGNLNTNVIGNLLFCFGSIDIQKNIVSYLDIKSKEIDKYIKKRKKEIALLKEYRQKIISQAVTCGLTEDGKLRKKPEWKVGDPVPDGWQDSGVEWLGLIPEGWEVKKLKALTDYITRGNTPDYVDDGIPVVNQATFSKGYFDTSNLRFDSNRDTTRRGILKYGDILLASTGGGVLGKSHYFEENGIYLADSHVTIIRNTKTKFFSKYVYYFFSTNFDLINGILARGATNQTELQKQWLKNIELPAPSNAVQENISAFLDKQYKNIQLEIDQIERQIEFVKEYKQSLISKVVTGKIDVRNINNNLSED